MLFPAAKTFTGCRLLGGGGSFHSLGITQITDEGHFAGMKAFDRLLEKPILHGPAKQHYVSNFYLNGFAETITGFAGNKRVAVYDRTNGAVTSLSPKKTATLEHFYTFIDEEDRQRFELEALFGIVESRAGSALKSTVCKQPLNGEDREYLALFIAMHAIRTPAALAESLSVREKVERAKLELTLPNEEAAYKLVKKFKPASTSENELHRLAEQMFEMVKGDQFQINIPDELARAASLKTWMTVAETLYNRDWTIVHTPADGAEYITSDSPVVLSCLSDTENLPLGYGSPYAQVLFPLSRNAALVMDGDEGRTRHVDARIDHVERFNATIASDCFRYVFGSGAEMLRKTIDPLNLTGTKWAPRMDVGIGMPPGKDQPAIWIRGLGRRPKW